MSTKFSEKIRTGRSRSGHLKYFGFEYTVKEWQRPRMDDYPRDSLDESPARWPNRDAFRY